jgi:hypothetical protein
MATREQHNQRIGRSGLPRISRALAAHLENTREQHVEDLDLSPWTDPEDAEEDFRMTHSITSETRQREGSRIHDPVDEYQAERMLHNYRKNRIVGYDQPFSREDIRDAYNSRFDY